MSRKLRVPGGARIAAGLGALLLLAATGCATAASRAEAEQRTRKAQSHLEIGADHLANQRTALALREFLSAEQLDPDNARVQYALGEAYMAQAKREDAEQHLRRALEIDPDDHDARLSLSGLLMLEGRYPEAIVECQTLIDDPTFPMPWRALANRGWAEIQLGRGVDARHTLELALEYQSDYWPAILSLAILDAEQGKRADALRRYEDIIALQPGPLVESEVNYRMAEVYIALGQRREAMGHLTTSVARAPEGRWARRSQEYLKLLH
jgi:type IV pilus assembly protein PilF